METYSTLSAKLAKRSTKKLANNTYAHRGENGSADCIMIRLHATDILTYQPDGSVIVNSGGWKTPTTRERIREYFKGAHLIQQRGQWYWSKRGTWELFALFTDGDTFNPGGELLNPTPLSAVKTSAKLRRRIVAYAKSCAAALPLEPPSAGDCLYCHMVTVGDKVPLGDACKNVSHLELHMEETYVVPSLVYHALKEAGCGPYYFAVVFAQPTPESDLMRKLGTNESAIVKPVVARAVAKYLRKRFSLP